MYVIAIIGDVCSMIPVVNIVSDFVTAIALGIAGAASDVNIYSSERIVGTLATMLIEAVPGVSMVPAWTVRVYLAKRQQRSRA